MKRLFLALPLLTMLTACSTTHEGVGALDDGSSVTAKRVVEPFTDHFTITSTEGWVCTGVVNYKRTNKSADFPMPLACTGGVTGSAVVSYSSALRGFHANEIPTIKFTLSNGKAGALRV